MKIFLSILIIFGFIFIAEEVKLISTIDLNSKQGMEVDPLGYIYLYNNDSIRKLDEQGNLIYRYSNSLRNNISYINASNAFKLILLDTENQLLLHFDNTLAPHGNEINLSDYQLYNVTFCTQNQFNILLYDSQLHGFFLLDQQGKIKSKSGNLKQLTGLEMGVQQMTFREKQLLISNGKMTSVFDMNGVFVKNIQHPDPVNWVQLRDKENYLTARRNKIYTNSLTAEIELLELPSDIEKFQIIGSKIYVKTLNKLYIYNIP